MDHLDFIHKLHATLCIDDMMEFWEAVESVDVYDLAEPIIKFFVDEYYLRYC